MEWVGWYIVAVALLLCADWAQEQWQKSRQAKELQQEERVTRLVQRLEKDRHRRV